MATVHEIDEKTLKISVDLEDALTMLKLADQQIDHYATDIITIYEKMPEFNYTFFCFYAYNSAALFEQMLGVDPKQYLSFSLDAPDAFFYTLYGGAAALYERAKQAVNQ